MNLAVGSLAMFGTLSYERNDQEPVFEADTTLPNTITGSDPPRRGTTAHKACKTCRARKLRCSGDPSGCDRCKASSNVCKYPSRTIRDGRKRVLVARKSPGTTSTESLSMASTTSSQSDLFGNLEVDFGRLDWQDTPGSTEPQDHALADDFSFDGHTHGFFHENSLEDFERCKSDHQARAFVGGDWSDATIDIIPELSVTAPPLTGTTSLEATKTYTGHMVSKSNDNSASCQCLGLVARLIEQVETQGSKSDAAIDAILGGCREALRQRRMPMACPRCKSLSECTFLLVMLAKSLSVTCNDLVQRYLQSRLDGVHGWPQVRVGSLLVDDLAEGSQIIAALIVASLNSLQGFIIDLKVRANCSERHLVLLQQIEERVKDLKTLML